MGEIRCVRGTGGLVAVLLLALTLALTACGAADDPASSTPLDSQRPPTNWTPMPEEDAAGDTGLAPDDDAATLRPTLSAPAVTADAEPR
jgi:hypothetical protein